jgi:coenzyme F420-reducing hydrogenase delta subunit
MLPPSFMDYIISRRFASGIFLVGCRENDCHYRLGMKWTGQRMDRTRDPYLRRRVPRERIGHCWCGIADNRKLFTEIEAFRKTLLVLDAEEEAATPGEVTAANA